MFRFLLQFIIILFLYSNMIVDSANAKIIYASSCSDIDVQKAIDSSNDGDTIVVPAGNCIWTAQVSIPSSKGIYLKGAGIDKTMIIPNTGGLRSLIIETDSTNSPFRLSGFTFSEGSTGLNAIIQLKGSAQDFRIDHLKFEDFNSRPLWLGDKNATFLGPYGIVDSCIFKTGEPSSISIQVENGGQGVSWNYPNTFGTNKAIYVENCTWEYDTYSSGKGAFDGCCGGRAVFRYNYLRNEKIGLHGYWSSPESFMQLEVYENTFVHDNGDIARFMFLRGGTGYIFNNTMISTGTPAAMILINYRSCQEGQGSICDGSASVDGNQSSANGAGNHNGGDNQSILTDGTKAWNLDQWVSPYNHYIYNLTDGSNGLIIANTSTSTTTVLSGGIDNDWDNGDQYKITNGYPCHSQIGRGYNQTLVPYYEYNNILNGSDADFKMAPSCDRQSDHIVENRDYYNDTQKPGYIPFTYPHPLTIEVPPSVPQNLRVIK